MTGIKVDNVQLETVDNVHGYQGFSVQFNSSKMEALKSVQSTEFIPTCSALVLA